MTYRTRTDIEMQAGVEAGIEALARAVVVQAVRDYHHATKALKKKDKAPSYYLKYRKELEELNSFFYGKDGTLNLYTSLPANVLLKERGVIYEEENH